ncbi:hypothetical protein SAY86_023668 [Trapa natans]|uniref:Uncharacterized protein n=1 Tax=Trapa natans TaxID=22666 RepID=A0AAN7RBQ1_TRANT|nr:hypothetical protein SAY86_023668 [Trapa natans]
MSSRPLSILSSFCSLVHTSSSYSPLHRHPTSSVGVLLTRNDDKRRGFDIASNCRVVPKQRKTRETGYDGHVPETKWQEIKDDVEDLQVESFDDKTSLSNEMEKRVDAIKSMLESMNDGVTEISISAYDTAWVGLVEAEESIMGSTDSSISNIGKPQFPECLRWIADNQLPDGSLGDPEIFVGYDRIINTLACIVALRKWDLYPDKCQTGIFEDT